MNEAKKKNSSGKAPHSKLASKEKEPEYMVQVNDGKVLRKDLLESLREIIIFMQGYEKFRKIQEEKVYTFGQLRTSVKEINSLVEKLKASFPKGKLKTITGQETEELFPKEKEEYFPNSSVAVPRSLTETKTSPNELDELESQLKDIEGQLRKIQ